MWPRIVELMLGLWLAVSPFVFEHQPQTEFLWYNDMISAMLVVAFSLACFSDRFRKAHFGTAATGVWLMASGYVGTPQPASENELVVGLLLVMLAIIPNEAGLPPPSWRALREDSPQNRSPIRPPL